MDSVRIPENLIGEVARMVSSRFGMRLDSFVIMNNISNSIITRMNLLDIDDPSVYFESRIRSPLNRNDEMKALFEIISVNETYFFRIPEHFQTLSDYIIPRILREKAGSYDNDVSIWSAGCSTGEEPYTIAIACREMENLTGSTSLHILGSDQDETVLQKASSAVYPHRAVLKTPPHLIGKYWRKQGSSLHLKNKIKTMVKFEKHNLNSHSPGDPFDRKWDVIFCRNVLIYFKKEASEALMRRFHECLNPGGYLILGPCETQHCPQALFESVMEKGVFIFKKKMADEKNPLKRNNRAREPFRGSALSDEALIPAIKLSNTALPDSRGAEAASGALQSYAAGAKLLESGDIEAAYAELFKAIETDPCMVPAYILIAVILGSKKRLEEAERYLNKALYHDVLCIPALFYIGKMHIEAGKIEKGILELEMVIKQLGRNKQIGYQETLGEINQETLFQACNRLIENNRTPTAISHAAQIVL